MSSDDYFKTICVANTYYNAQAVLSPSMLSPSNTIIYEFIPTGICTGNYPQGYMELASPALITAIQEIVNSNGGTSCFILRDMGKTMYAPISNATNALFAYFRLVQLICPKAIPFSGVYNNQLGGPNGSKYGIFGAPATPDAYTNYTTFYIPIIVGGIGAPNAAGVAAYIFAGGQM
jgi:hypothetical protein